jgi:hypothetical protein
MAEYRAKPGMEDRHGEMTGAISINMMLSMLPVTLWCFLSPYFVASPNVRLWVAVAMAVTLPIAFIPWSRKIWAWISTCMDGDMFRG